MTMTKRSPARTRLRIVLAPDVAIGPGKADLLQGIRETGSIAAAGRRMSMSYKRAWMLVNAMNHFFQSPLVETMRGGRERGGAKLTQHGDMVLDAYRRIEDLTRIAISDEVAALQTLLAETGPESGPPS
jgi:molybdate transport system regulatory protein